jgi:type II secretory ATPase GspE/PulE/Tfp pilus assembly ATPase PilB-like protein
MISLVQLLKEVQQQPKAILMAGPAGAGKSYTLNQLGLQNFTTINVDDDFEALLQKELGKSDFASMSPEELSIAAKMMGKARATTREKEMLATTNLNNIVIDGTGASYKVIAKKKEELENMGYDVFMVLIYVSPMTSLIRNAERGRSLPTSAVLKSWSGVVSNIGAYRQLFGNNIVVLNNDPSNANKPFDSEEIQKLFPQPKGKAKSPEELAKSKAEKEAVNKQIQSLLQQEPEFDTLETVKSKVNEFTR